MFLRGLRHSPRLLARFGLHTSHLRWASRTVTHTFKLADIGEGITECEIISWSVAPRATIASFDPLCEVQSDKASVEITSPFDGVVKELLVKEGEVARVGQGLCTIDVEEEVVDGAEEVKEKEAPAEKAPTPTPAPRAEAPTPAPESPPPVPDAAPRRLHPMDPSFTPQTAGDTVSLATPSVRHFARQNGVDLAQLAPGSGKGGRIEKADVEAFLSGSSESAESAPGSTYSGTPGQDIVVELGRTRWAMWRAMEKSLAIPQFGYSATLDITDLHALLPVLNAHIPVQYLPSSSSAPTKFDLRRSLGAPLPSDLLPPVADSARYARLTYLPFLMKTLARTMMDWPVFRSAITYPSSSPPSASTPSSSAQTQKPSLTIRPRADIALALSTPSGLYTPVIPGAEARSVYELGSVITGLIAGGGKAPSSPSAKSSTPQSATLTISNIGSIGHGTGAMPVLVPGVGVAIVAIGRAQWVWDVSDRWYDAESESKRGARRLQLPISWSADHRVVEGAELAAFMEAWRGWVENPTRGLGDGV